jgi:hypothetical protein
MGVDNELVVDKWYMLNIVRFKYLYSFTGLTNNLTKYRFAIVSARGNVVEKWYKKHHLENFDQSLLDRRQDCKVYNKVYGKEAIHNANEYSTEFLDKLVDSIVLRDFDKDEILKRTGESEDSLNENTIKNIG